MACGWPGGSFPGLITPCLSGPRVRRVCRWPWGSGFYFPRGASAEVVEQGQQGAGPVSLCPGSLSPGHLSWGPRVGGARTLRPPASSPKTQVDGAASLAQPPTFCKGSGARGPKGFPELPVGPHSQGALPSLPPLLTPRLGFSSHLWKIPLSLDTFHPSLGGWRGGAKRRRALLGQLETWECGPAAW